MKTAERLLRKALIIIQDFTPNTRQRRLEKDIKAYLCSSKSKDKRSESLHSPKENAPQAYYRCEAHFDDGVRIYTNAHYIEEE